MQSFEKVVLLAELENEQCGLNHGPGTEKMRFSAVNYLVLPIGFTKKDGSEVLTREMTIPVCQECVDGLADKKWTLLYCLECCASRWVHRDLAKNRYRHHVLWIKGCPDCTNQFGGLCFNDMPDAQSKAPHTPILAA